MFIPLWFTDYGITDYEFSALWISRNPLMNTEICGNLRFHMTNLSQCGIIFGVQRITQLRIVIPSTAILRFTSERSCSIHKCNPAL